MRAAAIGIACTILAGTAMVPAGAREGDPRDEQTPVKKAVKKPKEEKPAKKPETPPVLPHVKIAPPESLQPKKVLVEPLSPKALIPPPVVKGVPLLVPEKPDLVRKVEPIIRAGTPEPGRPALDKSAADGTSADTNGTAPASDLRLVSSTASSAQPRLARRFHRDGFPEVGFLAKDGMPFCSGVLLRENWVLTAAHCVATRDGAAAATDYAFYTPKPGTSAVYVVDRGRAAVIESAVSAAQPAQVHIHPRWSAESQYDVALVRTSDAMRIAAADLPRIARRQIAVPVSEVTIAGFGNVLDRVDAKSGGALEVGWQLADFSTPTNNVFRWTYEGGSSGSTFCLRDSGGPVFWKDQRGRMGEEHVVIGVMASLEKRPGGWFSFGRSQGPCVDAEAQSVRLDLPEVRSWVCTVMGNAVEGCQ